MLHAQQQHHSVSKLLNAEIESRFLSEGTIGQNYALVRFIGKDSLGNHQVSHVEGKVTCTGPVELYIFIGQEQQIQSVVQCFDPKEFPLSANSSVAIDKILKPCTTKSGGHVYKCTYKENGKFISIVDWIPGTNTLMNNASECCYALVLFPPACVEGKPSVCTFQLEIELKQFIPTGPQLKQDTPTQKRARIPHKKPKVQRRVQRHADHDKKASKAILYKTSKGSSGKVPQVRLLR